MARLQAKTAARGYSGRHQALRADYQRRMDQGEQFVCAKCRRLVDPTSWDLAHVPGDKTRYLGPQHVHCNRDTTEERRNLQRVTQLRRWNL